MRIYIILHRRNNWHTVHLNLKILSFEIKADSENVDEIEEFVGTHEISQIIKEGKKEYYFKKFNPREVERVHQFEDDFFAAIRSKDMIVHHPYEI